MDVRPVTGMNYYRLTQTDYDGHRTVYDADAVWMGSGEVYKLVPNPGTGEFHIFTEHGFHGDISILVTDISGKVQLMESKRFLSDQSSLYLDLTGLEPGVYHVQISNNGKIQTIKLMLQN